MVEFKDFSKVYKGNKIAVYPMNLTINEGEILGFIGHNGAGKTTTIKCLVGLLDFVEGDILFEGLSMKQHEYEIKKKLAYIPDNPDLYENIKGIDYINFIADMYEVDAKIRTERIEKYSNLFSITSQLGDRISSYSHGMKQKLSIISAFVHHPKLLVMDEPFVGLDPVSAINLKASMKELCATGSSIFFSTHVLEVAEKLCNRVAIIKNGNLLRVGDVNIVKGDQSLEEVFLEISKDE